MQTNLKLKKYICHVTLHDNGHEYGETHNVEAVSIANARTKLKAQLADFYGDGKLKWGWNGYKDMAEEAHGDRIIEIGRIALDETPPQPNPLIGELLSSVNQDLFLRISEDGPSWYRWWKRNNIYIVLFYIENCADDNLPTGIEFLTLEQAQAKFAEMTTGDDFWKIFEISPQARRDFKFRKKTYSKN